MNWDDIAREHAAVANYVYSDMRADLLACGDAIIDCIQSGGKVLVCGNGGSAADAQHLAAELVNRFLIDSRPYASIALTTDSSVLTSIGNDYSFDDIFSKQVEAFGQSGDLLIGISTSGNSPNVLHAIQAANSRGIHTVALTGGAGGALKEFSNRCLSVEISGHTPRIQEGHLMIIHVLCEYVEKKLHEKDEEV